MMDKSVADNFLPKFDPAVTHGPNKTLQCEIRGAVSATEEEKVRQRVLHWLICDKKWPEDNLRLEHPYKCVGDPERTRIRPDIELLVGGKVKVVIECKRPDVPLSESVDEQAIMYACKSKAEWIWTTNGDNHRFLKQQGNKWEPVDRLEPLMDGAAQPLPAENPDFPDDVNNKAAFRRYVKSLKDRPLQEAGEYLKQNERRFVLAMHRVLFGVEKKLPYSQDGVHILENRGSRWRNFTNASGGKFYTRYAEFIAATSGRVEAVSLAVSPNYINGKYAGLRLCAGVTKPKRSHLALELDMRDTHCPWDEKQRRWEIYHDGRMSRIPNATVMEAVREAGMDNWIDTYDDAKEWVCLGYLAESATWRNSKKLLANLIHYAIIRTNLREADAARRKASAA